MTNVNENEESQLDAIEDLDIATLRKYAKFSGIQAKKDWTKEDYVIAIKSRQQSATTSFVFDNALAPKPGYARILVHRDPTPGSKNAPIHAAINGRIFSIPRGIEVDVPEPLVGVLANAKTIDTSQQADATANSPGGVYRDVERPSYPFQVLAITPGKFENQHDARSSNYVLRKEFADKHGTWPTHAELQEYRKAKLHHNF